MGVTAQLSNSPNVY